MIGRINTPSARLLFVFRHRFEKKLRSGLDSTFLSYELGFFFKSSKIVGVKNFDNPTKWKLCNSYILGIELIVCKAWIEVTFGKPMTVKIDED